MTSLHCRGALICAIALVLAGCADEPVSTTPPEQRTAPAVTEFQPRSFIHMSDADATKHFVRDISDELEASTWRWSNKNPAVKLSAPANPGGAKFTMNFAISDVTLKTTGPITLTYMIDDHVLDKVRYDSPGNKTYEKEVPAEWLEPGKETTVSAEVDKTWSAANDGPQPGVILVDIGFVQQ
jgi:hypothetical protein